MRIVSWNCGGKFREKLPLIVDDKSDFYINADIYVIQECENPNDEEHSKYKEYKEVVEDNFQFVDFGAFLASVLYIIPIQPASKKYKKISIENTVLVV